MSFIQLSAVDQRILLASSILTSYGGMILFTMGAVGNTMNILAFTTVKTYRSLPSSIFLGVASLFGQIDLAFSVFMSALSMIIGYNPFSRNLSLCRAANFIPKVATQISLTCLCLSAIDRYLMTSRSARQRSWVTMKRAQISIVISILIWSIYGIPLILFANNIPFANICIPNPSFAATVTYLNLTFGSLLPIGILCLFGFLTWRNLNRVRLSSTHLQVNKMIMLDILVVAISNLPMTCFLIYGVTKRANRFFTPVETLMIYLTQLLSSIYPSGSFYFYLLVSPTFRKNIKMILYKILSCGTAVSHTRVDTISGTGPFTRPTIGPIAT